MTNKKRHFYEFGPYRIDPHHRLLLREGEPVPVQPKAFDILLALVQSSEMVVLKDDLMKTVWPDTFVEESNLAQHIFVLRKALGDPGGNRYIVTVTGRGYRFAQKVRIVAEEEEDELAIPGAPPSQAGIAEVIPTSTNKAPLPDKRWARRVVVLAAVILGCLALAWLVRRRVGRTKLTEKDTVVLADFANSTGDPVFDDTLKMALNLSLRQSPFINVLPEGEVAKISQQMTLPAGTKLTPEVARELCQRAGSKAYIAGAIGSLGTEYVLGLKAVNCQSGDVLVQEQVTAGSKETVLGILGDATSKLRGELGESLSILQKFDVPLEQATTSSLDALKAVTLSNKAQREKGNVASVPSLKRAVELDPNFALAYSNLAGAYNNLGESLLARENAKKAYDLRNRTSDRERFHIEAYYYMFVTGDLEKARQTYELWAQTYPRGADGSIIMINLAAIYMILGQWEKAETEASEAHRQRPNHIINEGNRGLIYLALNRPADSKTTYDEALSHKLDGVFLHQNAFFLAFLEGDSAEMERQVAWGRGKPGEEDVLLAAQADTEAYFGHIKQARESSRRAKESVERAHSKETAALYQAVAGVREAELGNGKLARRDAEAALELAPGRGVKILAAIAFARAGDSAQAHRLAQELAESPSDTTQSLYWLPIIRATIDIGHNPAKALELLEPATQYDLGQVPPINCLCSIYVRGEAYLRALRGKEAVAEFQKILDHRGIALNSIQGALAHLGLARGYAMAGDTATARTAYQDFFALWKDADPDIPILKQANAEYAKLR